MSAFFLSFFRYRNDLSIEHEPLGKLPESERAAALATEIQHLRGCLAGA
jgi:hypothetical protein